MKKTISIILIILILTPNVVSANYQIIDNSFELIYTPSWTLLGNTIPLIYQITNQITIDEVESAVKSIERRIDLPFDYKIHIMDFSLAYTMAIGLAFDENNIILFDFLPFKSKVLVHDAVAHEIGHLVYMRISEQQKLQYKLLRGIPLEYDDYYSDYLNKPREIFAEDFRLIFGSIHAKKFYHNNEDFRYMNNKQELKKFILEVKEGF